MRSKPRGERPAILEQLYEKFDKVLEVYFSINRGGRPKTDFTSIVNKFVNQKNINDDVLDKFIAILFKKYEELGGEEEKQSNPDRNLLEKKKNVIKSLRKLIGQNNI